MKVKNMTNSNGRAVPNQFIITDEGHGANGNFKTKRIFQSYDSIIAIITVWPANKPDECPRYETVTQLDRDTWDYSVTTSKCRNQFLDETKKETQAKINSGEYILTDLN